MGKKRCCGHFVYSSPFNRSVDTIKDFADQFEFEIEKVEDLRERKVADIWIENFNEFAKKQYEIHAVFFCMTKGKGSI